MNHKFNPVKKKAESLELCHQTFMKHAIFVMRTVGPKTEKACACPCIGEEWFVVEWPCVWTEMSSRAFEPQTFSCHTTCGFSLQFPVRLPRYHCMCVQGWLLWFWRRNVKEMGSYWLWLTCKEAKCCLFWARKDAKIRVVNSVWEPWMRIEKNCRKYLLILKRPDVDLKDKKFCASLSWGLFVFIQTVKSFCWFKVSGLSGIQHLASKDWLGRGKREEIICGLWLSMFLNIWLILDFV